MLSTSISKVSIAQDVGTVSISQYQFSIISSVLSLCESPRSPIHITMNTLQFVTVSWMVIAIPFLRMQRYKRGMIILQNRIKKFHEKGTTVGLMCRKVEPIKCSSKCSTMDSGFDVSMGVVDMENVQGVYGQALIKKR